MTILQEILAAFISFLFMLFLAPYAIGAIAIALLMAIAAVIFFGVEAITAPYHYVMKKFYCPFRKTKVEVKLRPSLFTFRPYDDVITCSAFKSKIRCGKRCLDLPEPQINKVEEKISIQG
jgi:cell division protein FtsW (lipid II flippase)